MSDGKSGASYGCFDTEDKANTAKDGVTTVDNSQFCLTSAGATNLPCGFEDEASAQAALDGITVKSFDTQYCVISSADVNLGCYLTTDEAQRKLQDTGQSRLLDLIGTTARLEEREVLEILQPGDPAFASQALTCDSDPQSDAPNCSDLDPDKLAEQDVWFIGQDGAKYHLGKVLVTGDMIKKATAVYQTSSTSVAGWQISFDLTKEGSGVFADVTTQLVGKQLAIVLDSEVISAPTVESPITNGTGVITGSFTEQRAKDLATVLNAGALPVQLEKLQTLTVSADARQGVVEAGCDRRPGRPDPPLPVPALLLSAARHRGVGRHDHLGDPGAGARLARGHRLRVFAHARRHRGTGDLARRHR